MVKKYYQDRKDRKDESHGMRHNKEMGHREEMGPRYETEHRGSMDSGYMDMIHEDRDAPSNLPQDVVHKLYPSMKHFDGYYLDDTIRGIDDNSNDSVRKVESHQSDSMY